MESRMLLMCGDIHGELKTLVYKLKELKIEHASIVVLGDFGVGFGGPHSMEVGYNRVLKSLEEKDYTIYTIRGNHDDPAWFDGKHDFPRLKFLVDHTVYKICGKTIYAVGGAVSLDIDRKDRKGYSRRDYNNRFIKFGSSKRCWWPGEGITKVTTDLPIRVDIVISHDSPISFDPAPMRPGDVSYDTWTSSLEEREYLATLCDKIRIGRWYFGHHHRHFSGEYSGIFYNGLDIMELCEVSLEEE